MDSLSDLLAILEDNDEEKSNTLTALTNLELREMCPRQRLKFDRSYEESISQDMSSVTNYLNADKKRITSLRKMAEYIPDLTENKCAKFWEENIIPIVMKSMTDGPKEMLFIMNCFGAVREFSINVQEFAELVKKTRAFKRINDGVIEVAQEYIPDAFAKLCQLIDIASDFENTAIDNYAKQTKQIFEIIGTEAVKYMDQIDEIKVQAKRLLEQDVNLDEKLEEKHMKVSHEIDLMCSFEKHIYRVKQDLERTKQQEFRLNHYINKVDSFIDNVPRALEELLDINGRESFELILDLNKWKEQKTDYKYAEEKRQSCKAEREDYSSLLSRLNRDLSKHNGNYEREWTELKGFSRTLVEERKRIKNELECLVKKANDIQQDQIDIEDRIGLNGDTLIEFLSEVQTYAKTLGESASVYTPLVSFLRGFKAMVLCDVELVSSTEKRDILLACNHLLSKIQFFFNFLQFQKV